MKTFSHPLSGLLDGAILSLGLNGNSFNLYSAIGLILLMGIAKKNSILLVEFFNKLRREHGKSLHDAILVVPCVCSLFAKLEC